MFNGLIANAVNQNRLQWQQHALERMLERDISRDEVKKALLAGEIIEEYPKDHPFPSGLFLNFTDGKPLHVVAAFEKETDWCYIITVYRPSLLYFDKDYKTRRK